MGKIDELGCIANEYKPDFIFVTECWCNDQISDAFLSLTGYELQQRLDRADTAGGRGGGIVIYTKIGLETLTLDKQVDFEQYGVFKAEDVTFYVIYRPPNGGQPSIDGLSELIQNAGKASVLVGDFNVPEIDWELGTSGGRTRNLLAAADEAMMEQMVDFPTHIRGNTLDLILTNIPERISDVEDIGRLGHSDHVMLMAKVEVSSKSATQGKEQLDWARADWDSMRDRVAEVDWGRELEGVETEEAWSIFKEKIHQAVRDTVPVRKRRNPNRPAWLTQNVLRAIRRKKRLWRRARDGVEVEEYREEEKRVRNLIRAAKKNFEKRLADGAGKDGVKKRQFFSYVRQRTKTRPSIGPLKDKDGNIVREDQDMATLLNSFFASTFTREDLNQIPQPTVFPGPPVETIQITEAKVRAGIRKLKKGSAAGPDSLGPQLLQELMEVIIRPLTSIMKSSLEEGTVPTDWRTANVTPIFKKGVKSSPGNYRPVSLTTVCCRLMETMIKEEVVAHLDRHQLIRRSQHGFMRGRSCTSNLLSFLEKVTEAADRGEAMDIVFLDFAKAFDKVPTQRLLRKVRAHGIAGDLYRWIEAWLSERRQRVVLNGKSSNWEAVLSGVPQGSVLGPLLFLIFINDLDDVAETVEIIRKFADDTKIAQSIRGNADRLRMQEALDNLTGWANQWGMQFNITKCKVMHVGRNNPRHEYTMNGQALGTTEEERDLGVIMTKNLKPAAQCAKAAKTANMVLGQITRSFYYRDRDIFVRLYKAYVRPHLDFAVQAWSPWTQADREVLEKVQRRMVRQVSGLRGQEYEERLSELGLTTLEERRHQADMQMVFKILNGKEDIVIEDLFQMAAAGERQTRRNTGYMNLFVAHGRLDIRANFFSVRVCECWNKIPEDIKRLKTVDGFKKAYAKLRMAH